MAWTKEGYLPESVDTIVNQFINDFNKLTGSNYNKETFTGTGLSQVVVPVAQLIAKLQLEPNSLSTNLVDYILKTNLKINTPATMPFVAKELFKKHNIDLSIDANSARGVVGLAIKDNNSKLKIAAELAELFSQVVVLGAQTVGKSSAGLVLDGKTYLYKYERSVDRKDLWVKYILYVNKGFGTTNVALELAVAEKFKNTYSFGDVFTPSLLLNTSDIVACDYIETYVGVSNTDIAPTTWYEGNIPPVAIKYYENIILPETQIKIEIREI